MALRRGLASFAAWQGLSENTKVSLVVGAIIALATYQTLGHSATKSGHHPLSSEKPEALRAGAGEARSLEAEKAKLKEVR